MHEGLEMQPDVQEGVTTYSYSWGHGDFHAENIRIGDGEIYFDFISPLGHIKDVQLGVPVSINIENGIAAMALAQNQRRDTGRDKAGYGFVQRSGPPFRLPVERR